MEKSKLPVRPRTLKSSDPPLPSAKKPCPPKPVLPLYSKDPNIAFSLTVPNFTMNKVVDNGKKTLPPKKTGPFTHRSGNRYRMESDLLDQNQLLKASNNTLNDKLQSAQSAVEEMSEKQSTMQEEITRLTQRLEKNMIILESRNIDPVSGEQILANAEETCKTKEETKTAAENLIRELKLFSSTVKEQKILVQTVKAKWTEAEESRIQFLEEQKAFQIDLEKFRSSLEETEKWLDL